MQIRSSWRINDPSRFASELEDDEDQLPGSAEIATHAATVRASPASVMWRKEGLSLPARDS
jgi:hypothetical protein